MEAEGYSRLHEVMNKMYPVPNEEMEAVQQLFTRVKQRKGSFFVSEGEIPDAMAFVVSGLYKYYYIDRNGNERIKHFSRENEFLSSYASLITRTPSLYYIEALEDSELLIIQYADYNKGVLHNSVLQNVARVYTERMYTIKEQREGSFLKESAQERYLRFLKEQPELIERVTQKNIASYLGMTPESMSRIKRQAAGAEIGEQG